MNYRLIVKWSFAVMLAFAGTAAFAQEDQQQPQSTESTPQDNAAPAPANNPAPTIKKGGGDPKSKKTESSANGAPGPLDGAYKRKIFKEKRVLQYDHLREADVFWEKRVWRVIDVREKMNKSFMYPKEYFINILMEAAKNKEVTLYSNADGDEFKTALTPEEVQSMAASSDTVTTYNQTTFQEEIKVVNNDLNPDDIKRFRVKEVWFFDKESSTLQVRVLGIAPIKEVKDDKGNFKYEQPMFWAYYPTLRQVLARHEAFNPANDAQKMTWEDVFEMRYFSSYIIKESNVYDRRIQDYKTGLDLLFEGENIKNSIFNFEHDLWSY